MPYAPLHLTLVVPRLQHRPVDERLPALETLLARGAWTHTADAGLESCLFRLFGVNLPEGADAPVGALCRLADTGIPNDGWWSRADPVHLMADRDRVFLAGTDDLQVPDEEAQALVGTFNAHFAADALHLEALTAHRWYLTADTPLQLTATPPEQVLGADIHDYLPSGADAPRWRAWLTETQMLFHTHRVNLDREARGEPVVNGLWLWGVGRLPQSLPMEWKGVTGNGCLGLGLAKHAGTPTDSFAGASGFERWAPGREGCQLVIFEAQSPIEELEVRWLSPALRSLRAGSLVSLTLEFCDGRACTATAGALRRWWWRRRPWQYYLETGRDGG